MSEAQTQTKPSSGVGMLFCDVCGSTALYQKLGSEKAQALIQEALGRLEKVTALNHGRVVKTIGDEVMCRFDSSSDAARAAIEMQQQSRIPLSVDKQQLRFRIGFACGPTVEKDGDVFGDVVNIASRLASLAKADQILTTEGTAATLDASFRGSTRLFDKTPVKGVKEEVSVVQVQWDRSNQTSMVRVGLTDTTMATRLKLASKAHSWSLIPADLPRWLGRSEECELMIPSNSASRKHAKLEYRRGKFMLTDESTNGTYVEMNDGGQMRVIYLRNETFALVGSGRFALGARPESDEHAISFTSK